MAIVFSLPSQFVLASKLYKLVQRARAQSADLTTTQGLMDELSYLGKDYPWSSSQSCGSSAAGSTPTSSHLSKSCAGNVAGRTSSSQLPTPSQLSQKRSHGVSSNCGSTERSKTMSNFTLHPLYSSAFSEMLSIPHLNTINLLRRYVQPCEAFAMGKGSL